MGKIARLLLIVFCGGLIACDSKNNSSGQAEIQEEGPDSVWNNVRSTLKGAALADTLTVVERFYFSNDTLKDCFELKVSPGLIANSTSTLTIKSFNGSILHSETFDNDYLVRYIFDPKQMPANLDQEAYSRFFYAYGKALSKKQFEHYTQQSARSFFSDCVSLVTKSAVVEHTDFGNVDDERLYAKVMQDSFPRILNIPCFSCDEGHSFYVYSPEEGMAKSILSAD